MKEYSEVTMKKGASVSLLLIVLICSFALARGVVYLSEDFERYSVNAYPAGFVCAYDGTGKSNQKVITANGPDGSLTKVFRLQGKNSWGSQQDFPLPSLLPDRLIVQAYVKPIGNQLPGSIGLRNPDVGTWGTGIGGVGFSGNGKLNAMGGASTSYRLGVWYFIDITYDFVTLTADVRVDGKLLSSGIPFGTKVKQTHLFLHSGNQGQNEILFDEITVIAIYR